MSSDNETIVERRRVKPSAEDRQVGMDVSTDVVKIERTRKKKGFAPNRDKLTAYQKYIPKGYVGRFENPAMDQCLLNEENDWTYALDETGGKVYVTANADKNANNHKFVLMIKPQEWVDADRAEEAAYSAARLTDTGKTDKLTGDNFQDLGYRKEKL